MKEPFRPDLEDVFEHYGARILSGSGDWQKATCPLTRHEDTSPSASVNIEAGKWRCFSCDVRGDAYDILKENESIAGFVELVQFAEANFRASDSPIRADRGPGGRLSPRKGNRPAAGGFVPPWRSL